MSTVARRILAGLGANAFGQAVHVTIQLLSIPLFLRRWDVATYGVWLMLSATPAYLGMADVGMVTVAGNRMTMAMGRGEAAAANVIFQSALALIGGVCIGLALLVVPICWWAPLPGVTSIDQRVALAALAVGVLIGLFGGLSEAIFRATGRYPIAAFLGGVVRIGEWCGWLIGLWLVGSFAAVALGGLAIRLIGTLVCIAWAGGRSRGIVWGIRDARLPEVRAMVKPSISFMAFPLANALSLQGVTLLVGALFGPALVAVFNAYRTLARVAVQLTSMFSLALWPEFSRLFGSGAAAAIRPLYRRAELLGGVGAIGLSLTLYWLGPWLLRIWTHGVIGFEPGLMGLLLAYAAAGGLWHVPRTLLMATNQHIDLAGWALAGGVAVIAAARLMAHALGLQGVGLAMLVTEMALAVVCLRLVHQTLRETVAVRCGTLG
jgi:O-antigen/teichoic acid export membrane protein